MIDSTGVFDLSTLIPKTQYWHLLTGYDADTDLFAQAVMGPTDLGPDDPGPNGTTPRRFSVPAGLTGMGLELRYAASFTHEPTDEDRDTYAPAGHRSWEQDEDVLGPAAAPEYDDE